MQKNRRRSYSECDSEAKKRGQDADGRPSRSAAERSSASSSPRGWRSSILSRHRLSVSGAESLPVDALKPLKDGEIVRSDISVGEVIGEGRFKRVLAADYRGLASVVIRFQPDPDHPDIAAELALIERLSTMEGNEQYVPMVRGFCREQKSTLVVQELASYGSLKAVLQKAGELTPSHLTYFAARMASAVGFLAAHKIVHADLSCRNFLVCKLDMSDPSAAVVKVSDFGLAIVLKDDEEVVVRVQPQATRWCAPETVAHRKWSRETDVWSLGCTFWEMYSGGKNPWVEVAKRAEVADMLRQLEAAAEKDEEAPVDVSVHLAVPAECPPGAYAALLSCLRQKPSCRPTAVQVATTMEEVAKDPSCDKTRGATTPSTIDTPRPGETPGFEALRAFLASPGATSVLGESATNALRKETEQACQLLAKASLGHMTLPLHANADLVTSGPTEQNGRWTVWWLLRPTVWRREFVSEAEARDVFECSSGCSMLQNPSGVEVASRDWPLIGRALVGSDAGQAPVPQPDLRVPRLF
mmetsp:Transcript_17388/g.40601  ORF Transcript_17388/g.40601 Transcript_17388/m.40601 type:complete len:527 (-) Transcript_17388:109-1689(-)